MTEETNWYVLAGTQKYGPYTYREMIGMQQSHQLMDFNYVWAAHLEAWTPLHQTEEFTADRFRLLLQGPMKDAFTLRRHPRREVNLPLIAHNTIRFFDGKLLSLSKAGALCLFNSPLIQVGDTVKICLNAGAEIEKNFSLAGRVVRKNFSRQRLNAKSGLHYAVVFSEIHPAGLKQIELWAS